MKRRTLGIMALGAFLALSACTESTEKRQLAAAERRALLPGAVMAGEIAGGGTWRGTYFRNGTMAIETMKDGQADSDTGVWHFEGDAVCLTWKTWREAKPYCLHWMREGDAYAACFTDGRPSTTFEIVGRLPA